MNRLKHVFFLPGVMVGFVSLMWRTAIKGTKFATPNKWTSSIYTLVCVVLYLGTGGVGSVDAESSSFTGPKNVGRQYFERYCSACHGNEGRGDGPVASLFRTPPADLTRIAERRGGQFPDAEIAAYIDGRADVRAHGNRDMPVWGERFSEMVGSGSLGEEVVRGNLLVLIQYLRSIQHQSNP